MCDGKCTSCKQLLELLFWEMHAVKNGMLSQIKVTTCTREGRPLKVIDGIIQSAQK